jgi:formate/nitrite transporter FocA (FNT family)
VFVVITFVLSTNTHIVKNRYQSALAKLLTRRVT